MNGSMYCKRMIEEEKMSVHCENLVSFILLSL
jgi:hypothetical protein